MALRAFPQYTITDIYTQFNANRLNLLLESNSRIDYDEKTFTAKCHGLIMKDDKPPDKMKKEDWKLFMNTIKKANSENRLNKNLGALGDHVSS